MARIIPVIPSQAEYGYAYHPQTDGQTERVNQCLEMYLRCSVQKTPTKWKAWLALAEFWYNTSHHATLGSSLFKALYGYDPNTGAIPTVSSTEHQSTQEILATRIAHSA